MNLGFSVLSFVCIKTSEGLHPVFHRQMMLLCEQGTLHQQVEEVSSSVLWFIIEITAMETTSLRTSGLP